MLHWRMLIWRLSVRLGSEDFVLTARVQAENAQTLYQSGIRGQREADVTARVAAEVAPR